MNVATPAPTENTTPLNWQILAIEQALESVADDLSMVDRIVAHNLPVLFETIAARHQGLCARISGRPGLIPPASVIHLRRSVAAAKAAGEHLLTVINSSSLDPYQTARDACHLLRVSIRALADAETFVPTPEGGQVWH